MEMHTNWINHAWLLTGVVLMVLELVIPGLISVFLGLGAILTALLSYFGILESISSQITFFFISSFALILIFRERFSRWFPSLEKRDFKKEEVDIIGKSVEILSDTDFETSDGRARFQGTTWNARSLGRVLRSGEKAIIVKRENLTLLLAPPEEEELRFKVDTIKEGKVPKEPDGRTPDPYQ